MWHNLLLFEWAASGINTSSAVLWCIFKMFDRLTVFLLKRLHALQRGKITLCLGTYVHMHLLKAFVSASLSLYTQVISILFYSPFFTILLQHPTHSRWWTTVASENVNFVVMQPGCRHLEESKHSLYAGFWTGSGALQKKVECLKIRRTQAAARLIKQGCASQHLSLLHSSPANTLVGCLH